MQHLTTPTTDELRTAVSAAELDVQAALGKVREARMRHASALAAQGVPTDTLGNVEGDNRDWCLGDEGDCMGDCGGRFHDPGPRQGPRDYDIRF
jgi:hypothetical protein